MKKLIIVSLLIFGCILISPKKVLTQTDQVKPLNKSAIMGLKPSSGRQLIQFPSNGTIQKSENQAVTFTNDNDKIEVIKVITDKPQAKDVLLDEGFESWPPADWNFYEQGVSSTGWQQSSFQPYAGSFSALHGYFAGGVHDNWIISPQLLIDQTYDLKFWDKLTSYNYYEYSGVLISTGSGDPSSGDFVEIYNAGTATPNIWSEHVIDLSAFIGENIFIAFQYSGNNAHRWYIDEVKVIPLTFTDGGITTITNPPVGTTTTGGSIEDVTIILENFGTDVIENADFEWMVNGVPQIGYSATNLSLEQGNTIELIIDQFDFSEYDEYALSTTCIITGDQNSSNDTKIGTYVVDDLGDAGIIGITPSGISGPAYLQDVKVVINNFGVQVLESVEIEWKVDGVDQTPYIASNLGINPGSSKEETIGQFDFSVNGNYEIFCKTNLVVDYVPSNDSLTSFFASGVLRESFEGPHNQFWPPDHWLSLNASPLTDWPYHGDYMGHILSGTGEFGETDGWLATPLLDISPGDIINFQLSFDLASGGGFSINWMDGTTGELHFMQNVTVTPGSWHEQNIDISAASGVNRIVFKVHSDSYAETFLDYVQSTAPVFTHQYDLEVLRFEQNWTPVINEPQIVTASIRNYTANFVNAGEYTVKLMEEPGIELASLSGMAIQPNETIEHQFNYTFVDEDQHSLYIEIEYANDQNETDNLSNIVSVYPIPSTTQFNEFGNADMGNLNIPFDTFGTEGLGEDDFTQIIYHVDEVGSMGYLHGIKFHYYLYGLIYGQELPLTVWVGETLSEDLSEGWEPHENMTLVFDSLVITHNYENEMYIPFNSPYLYTGGNLVVQIIQHDPSFPASWTNFYTTLTPGEIRTAKSPDWYEIDPQNPPSFEYETQHWEQIPDATFILNPFEDLAEISGTVYDEESSPIENALIEVLGTAVNTNTNNSGTYNFPTIPFGEWTIKASNLGYEDNLQVLTVDNNTEVLDFTMIPKPLITLSGSVEGSDAPGTPLEGVNIAISGYTEYSGTTNSTGIFSIEGVYGNADYFITVSKFGYESYTTEFSALDENLDFGDILLQHRLISTFDVSADEDPDDFVANIYWPDPLTGMEDTLKMDTGDEAYGLANEPMENVWLGNYFQNDEVITITSVTVFFINNPQTSGSVALDIFDEDENLLISSENFFTQNNSYLHIDFPNLTYDGNLYIMLHWKDNPATTDMLGIDFSPGIQDLCYIHYPGEGFQLLSGFLGTEPGVALIRPNVLKYAEDKAGAKNKSVSFYNLYKGESNDLYNISGWEQVNSEPVTALEYMDESWLYTEPNEYRFAVEAVYVDGTADVTYSNSLSIAPVAPTNLTIDIDPGSGGTLFSWDSPEHNVQHYDVFLDDLNNPIAESVTDLSYVFTEITPGLHEVGVRANYNTSQSDIETTTFTISNVFDLNTSQLKVYPNPARNTINIAQAKGYEIQLINLSGRVCIQHSCKQENETLNVSELKPGIYMIRFMNETEITYRKIEIIK